MLNPIESVWSVLNAKVKERMAAKMEDVLNGVNQGSLTKTEFRLRILEEMINNSLCVITPGLCNAMIAKVQPVFPSALNLQE